MKDPSLLGIVMMYVDYTRDIEKIKMWGKDIVEKREFADKEKVAVVEIVDFTDRVMALRILAKGSDALTTWSLRCKIREKFIRQFKEEAGLPLPRIRIDTIAA